MLSSQENHLLTLIKHKFVSQYKILYMIDQKEADHYQQHYSTGCCSHSHSKPKDKDKHEDSKIIKIVLQKTSRPFLINHMDKILQFCYDRYQNIVEGGKRQNMEVTKEVEKFLIDKVLSEGVNNYLYKEAIGQIRREGNRMGTQIGLWATPATWYARYPKVKLQLLNSNSLSQLHNRKYTIITNTLDSQIQQLWGQLVLLQKDGRFEQVLFRDEGKNDERKVLLCPQNYVSAQHLVRLRHVLILIQSIPFEINQKMNKYLTVAQSLKISYYKQALFVNTHRHGECQYSIVFNVGSSMKLNIDNEQVDMKNGSLLIVDSSVQYGYENKGIQQMFIITNSICEAGRK